jgi:hypothetical protein
MSGFNIGSALSGALQGLTESGGNPYVAAASGAVSGFSGGSSASSPLTGTPSSATSGLGALGLGSLDNIVSELLGGSGADGNVNALAQLAGSMLGSGAASLGGGATSTAAPSAGLTVPQPSTSAQSTFRSFSSMQPQAQGGDSNAQMVGDPGDAGDTTAA